MINNPFYNDSNFENHGAENINNGTSEAKLDAKDSFFFYPLYLKDKSQAKKLFKIYSAYSKNRAHAVKEIIDIDQLLNSRMLNTNIDSLLTEETINRNYAPAFEDLVRRLSQYTQNTGKVLFNSSEEIYAYQKYLIDIVKPSLKEYKIISQFIDKNNNHKK